MIFTYIYMQIKHMLIYLAIERATNECENLVHVIKHGRNSAIFD